MTMNPLALGLLLLCVSEFSAAWGICATSPTAVQNVSPCAQDVKIVQGRLEIPALKHPLKLEEANEIPIVVHGYKVYSANASWSYYTNSGDLWPPDDEKVVAVLYHGDDSPYVEIIPEKLGKLRLGISSCFEDGGAASASVDAEVVFPEREPEKLLVAKLGGGYDDTSGTIYMALTERPKRRGLVPLLVYKGASHPTPIPAEKITFKVISANESAPPISIDKSTGEITAHHLGHALVQTTFNGLSTLTCIDVLTDARDGSDRTVCAELVPAGMVAPTTGFDANRSAPQVKPRKQP